MSGKLGHNGLEVGFGEAGKPAAAAATEFGAGRERGCGDFALRAERRELIPAPGPALKKCAPVLFKLLRSDRTRHLTRQLAHLLAKCGVFLLQVRELAFEQNKLVLNQSDAFLEHQRRAMLADESFDFTEKRDGHE